jgi:hypothetical protein
MNNGAREAAAALLTKYFVLSTEERREFDKLYDEFRNPPHHSQISASWFTNSPPPPPMMLSAPQTAAPAPAPNAVVWPSVPPAPAPLQAHSMDDMEEEDAPPLDGAGADVSAEELEKEPLDDRCFNVCIPKKGTECDCRYKMTEKETERPVLHFNTVVIFFPSQYYAQFNKKQLIGFVYRNTDTRKLVVKMVAFEGYWNKQEEFVIPRVLVRCKTHAHATRFYTLWRKAIVEHGLSVSLNWGRKGGPNAPVEESYSE